MLSALLNLPDLGIDPATGRLRTGGATKVVKKVVKKVTKAATQAATANVATQSTDNTEAIISVPSTPPVEVVESVPSSPSLLEEFVTSLDPTVTALVLGALILIAFIIYRRKFSATGQVGNSVLIVGNMGAGKTALYYQLKQGIYRDTHTSMKENDDTFVAKALEGKISPWRYVDLPGHASQRVKLDQLKSTAKCVLFVVDGSQPDAFGKVAQFLYTLLVDPVFTARRTPFFIAINKKDKIEIIPDVTADEEVDPIHQMAERLEKILDKTRGLQSTMSDLGADKDTVVRTLGIEGEPFKFSDSVCPISYGGISASKGELQDVLDFLQAQ